MRSRCALWRIFRLLDRRLLGKWNDALGEAWRDVQTLLFRAGIQEPERKTIKTSLARIDAVRQEMRAQLGG